MDDRIKDLWAEYEPRIQAAKAADNRDRHRFFCDDLEETIGDFPAVVLTLERYLLVSLEGVFDDGEDDPRIPVLRFLWIVSPDYSNDPAAVQDFVRSHRDLDPMPYPEHIREYMDRAFAYAAKKSSNGKGDKGGSKESSEWFSSIVDTIASEYGWSERDIMRLPLPRLFLYVGRIRQRLGLDSATFSAEADRLKDEFMRESNERN